MPDIILKIPGYKESRIQLIPGVYRVGSSPASHISLKDSSVHPRHCRFEVTADQIMVFDLCGETFLNGKTICSNGNPFVPGDILWVGSVEFRYPAPEKQEEKQAEKQMLYTYISFSSL